MSTRSEPSESALTFGGTPPALLNQLGIDASSLPIEQEGARRDAVGNDGQIWHLTYYPPMVHAFRERTPEETVRWADECNSRRICSYFTADRLQVCRLIAQDLIWAAWQMSPDHPMPRRARRNLKKRMNTLLLIQIELMGMALKVDMGDVRRRMAGAGMDVVQYGVQS